MSTVGPILIVVLLSSIGALAGGLLLLFGKKISENVIHVLASFAAGALLGTTFFDLLPEAAELAEEQEGEINIFLWVLVGTLIFYLLDRGVHWFQYHRTMHAGKHGSVIVPLIIISDSVHNFIDGVAIAVTFMVNPAFGVITAIAVAAHELPQEIGDFAVLLHAGASRKKVLIINIVSALFAVAGAALALTIGERIEGFLPYALALTGGFFIYIALTHLIPEIHSEEKKGYALWESLSFFFAIVLSWIAIALLSFLNLH